MRLGYMAVGNDGRTIHLTGEDRPRKQLLEKLGATHAENIYVDLTTENRTKHIGYIVQSTWFTIYEVHDWEGKSTKVSAA